MRYYLTMMLTGLLILPGLALTAQDTTNNNNGVVIDEVVALVGRNIILKSDIENQYITYKMQRGIRGSSEEIHCRILEDLLYQKLMVVQAEYDSIEVTPDQVNSELDRRISSFIGQFGSQEKLEKFYGRSLTEIKSELSDIIKEQLLAQQVQNGIISSVTITPSEVRSFFNSLPKDSIPLIKTHYVIAEIVKKPPISVEEKLRVKERLLELRKRILKGESFATMAILYSEDPGSAKNGGELGFYGRGQLYPEFEAVAFKLKEGEISSVVETEAGYHIIQLIERKGDYVNVRHILLVPKVSPEDLMIARNELDSVAALIRADSITFDQAVEKFSDAEDKNNGGLLINPYTGGTTWEAEQLDPQVSFTIEKMKVGEISNAVPMKTEKQKDAYRLLMLKEKTEPHRASLKTDYSYLEKLALHKKQAEAVDDWINRKMKEIYVKIKKDYQNCPFKHNWLKNQKK